MPSSEQCRCALCTVLQSCLFTIKIIPLFVAVLISRINSWVSWFILNLWKNYKLVVRPILGSETLLIQSFNLTSNIMAL
jgi:hypothetical protein